MGWSGRCGRRWAAGGFEEVQPAGLVVPFFGQVDGDVAAAVAGDAGGDGDQAGADGGAAGPGVEGGCEYAGGAGQVGGDGGQGEPGGVGWEVPGR
jgi:hypothetical protein